MKPSRKTESIEFDIQPYVGALPIRFGMTRAAVHRLLGVPASTYPIWDGSGTSEHFPAGFTIGYSKAGKVTHLGFSPGDAELTLAGKKLWTKSQQPDPNPALLALDPAPWDAVGFWIFDGIGVTTTGYHDDDASQRAITVYPRGAKARILAEAEPADTVKYQSRVVKRKAKKRPAKKAARKPKTKTRT